LVTEPAASVTSPYICSRAASGRRSVERDTFIGHEKKIGEAGVIASGCVDRSTQSGSSPAIDARV